MMKAFATAALLFTAISAKAWTPQLPNGRAFNTNNITIYVANQDCRNSGLQVEDMVTFVEESIRMYWGRSGSGLRLTYGGTRNVTLNGDREIGASMKKTPWNSIIVGCNDDSPSFKGSVLGIGGLGCWGNQCRGAVILNDKTTSQISRMPHARVLMVFAHELGHAVGLGHSQLPAALMYYTLGTKLQESLHRDDVIGVRSLYPIKR